jgi:hypothetical protein
MCVVLCVVCGLITAQTEEEEQLEAFKSQTSSKFSEEKERIQAKKKGIQKHLTCVASSTPPTSLRYDNK